MAAQENQPAASGTAPAETGRDRLVWIDLIRAGGAFLVVLAHVILYPALRGAGPIWAQTLYYASTRVAVPLFFMASGFLLLGRDEPIGAFLRKRALRVFVPFLIWSFIYLAWNGGFAQDGVTLGSVLVGVMRIVRGPREAHLWFFYVLIGLYLATPVLRLFARHASARDLIYFCSMWLLLDPVVSLVRYLTPLQFGFELQFFTGYIGYFMLGYLLGRAALTRPMLIGGILVGLVSFVFVFLAIYIGQQQKSYDQFFEGYLSVPVVAMTAAGFTLLRRYAGRLPTPVITWINRFSSASLGIYLVHVIVLDVMNGQLGALLPWLGAGSSIWVMPVVGGLGFAVCYGLVALMQHIPVIRHAVP